MNLSSLSAWWNTQSPYKQDCIQGAITGAAIGIGVTTVINAVEKTTTQSPKNYNPKSFSKSFYRKTFAWLPEAIADSTVKNVVLFGTIPLFQRVTNLYFSHQDTSYLIAAICSSALISVSLHSFQVIKTKLSHEEAKTSSISRNTLPKFKLLQLICLKSIMSTLHSSLYWVSYLYVSSQTNKLLKEKKISPSWLPPVIAGYLGAFASSLLTHPIDVIAKRKEEDPSFRISHMKEKKEGVTFLFKGIFKKHFARVLIPGILIEATFDQADKIFKKFKNSAAKSS